MHRAFTLLELLIVIAIVAMTAALALPSLTNDSRLRVMAAADLMSSDIEFAQAMSVGDPANPMAVRLDPDSDTYWVALAAEPETPITRDDTGEPYIVTLGEGRAAPAAGVTFTLSNLSSQIIEFDAYGTVSGDGSNPVIQLSMGGETITLTVSAATGSISLE